MSGCIALIVASGRGQRFGHERPKQYARLGGVPLLRHTLTRFVEHPKVDGILAVIHPDDQPFYEEAARDLALLPPVFGGATRQDSCRLGLEGLAAERPQKVLIQDGARPLTKPAVIDRVIEALERNKAVIPALPVGDTLKRAKDGVVTETVDRQGLFRVQTPQGFSYDAILAAHRLFAGQAMTDDASLAEAAGLAVAIVPGDETNIKVTVQEDLMRAERQLSPSLMPRTGMGFDVHRLKAAEPGEQGGLVLMGLCLPDPLRMIGHSDADVGLHAITDALFGALASGDIGSHFPPSDPTWKGTDSAHFLIHAVDAIDAAGGSILHVDATLICERPKIGPHRDAMRERLSSLLRIPQNRVSIKATTTERLGFTGRGEGIAAQAVATVLLPL